MKTRSPRNRPKPEVGIRIYNDHLLFYRFRIEIYNSYEKEENKENKESNQHNL